MDVSVVVVTYNCREYARRCLASVYRRTRDLSFEVIVVDNASGDGTADMVAAEFPQATLLRERDNGGFARGVNRGIASSTGEAVLLLNPDAELTGNALPPLLSYLRSHEDCAIVAPRLSDPDGTLQLSCRAFPGFSAAFFNRYSLLTRLLGRNPFSRRYLMTGFDHHTVADVDWVSGACWLLSRAAYDAIGPLDEGYFWSIEDVDYCQRAHRAGRRVVYFPAVVVTHEIGRSASAVPGRAIIARHRGMWRYYRSYLRPRWPVLRQAVDVATAAAIAMRCGAQLLAQRLPRRRSNLASPAQ